MCRSHFPRGYLAAFTFVLWLAAWTLAVGEGQAEIRVPFNHQLRAGTAYGNGGLRVGGPRASFSCDSRLIALVTDVAPAKQERAIEIWDLSAARKVFVVEPSAGPSEDFALRDYQFLRDGRTFAALFHAGGGHAAQNQARLFDIERREERTRIDFGRYAPISMGFSPDGATAVIWLPAMLTRPKGHKMKIKSKLVAYDTATGARRKELDTCELYGDAAYSPDGKWLATVHANSKLKGQVILWDAATLERRFDLNAHASWLTLSFSADGKSLAAAIHREGDEAALVPGIRIWDVESGKEIAWLRGDLLDAESQASVYAVFAPQGGFIVACCQSRSPSRVKLFPWEARIKLWNLTDGRETLLDRFGSDDHPLESWWYGRTCAAFSSDGSVLATPEPSSPASVKFWETKYWRPIKTVSLRGRAERRFPLLAVGRMEFSPDGQWFAAWCHDKSLWHGEVVIQKLSDELMLPVNASD